MYLTMNSELELLKNTPLEKYKKEGNCNKCHCIEKHKNEMPLLEISKNIDAMTVKAQMLYKEYEKKRRENATLKTSYTRLNFEVQKQIIIRNKLINTKNGFVQTEEEYKCFLDEKIKMKSITDTQHEEIERLLAVKKDTNEFINQQRKMTNGESSCSKTSLFLKRKEIENENEYYKLLCKEIFIKDILRNDYNLEKFQELTEKRKILKKKFHNSVTVLKNVLRKIDLLKSNEISKFDSCYEGDDKSKILKLVTFIFNCIITVGHTQLWSIKAELTKIKAEHWTVKSAFGKSVEFHSPFSRSSNNSSSSDGDSLELVMCK